MISPKYARGARVVVRPPDDVPELVEIAGQTGLVVDTTHPEHPEATVLSLDANPGAIVLVDQAWLAPVDDRACMTLDPRCCALAPCAGCLVMFQAHLRAALTAAGLAGDQGVRFVTEWNAQREKGRAQSLELVRQARGYAMARMIEAKAEEQKNANAAGRAADGVDGSEPGRLGVGAPSGEGERAERGDQLSRPGDDQKDAQASSLAGVSPQVLPSEDVEKKSSTKRRKPAKTAVPSAVVEAPSQGEPPAAAEGATGDSEAAG